MATQCEDCGDGCQRRTRCPRCELLVCRWCYNHVHGPHAAAPESPLVALAALSATYLDADGVRRQRSRGQMPLQTYSPEEQAAFICANWPHLDHAVVLAFERSIATDQNARRAYMDFLEDHGVWERLNELEANHASATDQHDEGRATGD